MNALPSFLVLILLLVATGCTRTPQHTAPEAATVTPPPAAEPPPAPEAPPLDAPANMAPNFVASTNEPFWTVSVKGDAVVLTGLDGERELALQSNEQLFDGRNVIATDEKGRVEVRVTPRACQDSMSGEDFPYTVRVTVDQDAPVLGCARDP